MKPLLRVAAKSFFVFRSVDHALGIRNSGDGVDARSRADVDHFDRIVPQRRHEQLIFPVRTKMIETPLHAGQGNGFPSRRGAAGRFSLGFLLRTKLDCESSEQRQCDAEFAKSLHLASVVDNRFR